jgi:ATP phosphoribosyltransferase
VKGLKVGTCTLSVAVTPKATAKVKKPKTVTKRTKVIVTK